MFCKCPQCDKVIIKEDLKEVKQDEIIGCISRPKDYGTFCKNHSGSCKYNFGDEGCEEYHKSNLTEFIKLTDIPEKVLNGINKLNEKWWDENQDKQLNIILQKIEKISSLENKLRFEMDKPINQLKIYDNDIEIARYDIKDK